MKQLRRHYCYLLMLFCTTLHADFYAGAMVGPEGANFTQRAYVSSPGSFVVIDKNHFSGVGLFASVLGGYSWRYQRYYFAGEGNLNISSVEHRLSNDEYVHYNFLKTRFTLRHSEGISFLPGFYLGEQAIFYGRIGYTNASLRIRESDPTIQSTHKSRGGLRYGIGSKYFFTTQFALLLDYSQINYRNVKSYVYEPFGQITKVTKISPDTAQIGVGIVYHFDKPVVVAK